MHGRNERISGPVPGEEGAALPGKEGAAQHRGRLRYWAAAREAAGTAEEPYAEPTLAAALAAAVRRHGDALARVLDRCSYVVDGMPAGRRDPAEVALRDGGIVDVLPPFAGGAGDLPVGARR